MQVARHIVILSGTLVVPSIAQGHDGGLPDSGMTLIVALVGLGGLLSGAFISALAT